MLGTSRSTQLLFTSAFITILLAMTATTYGFQNTAINNPANAVKSIPPAATPTPTPNGMIKSPTPKPDMTKMKSSEASSSKAEMGDDMMGAAGLVPPGIMVGKAGRWMVGYQVMFDRMDGNLVGTRRISDAKILERFMATPTDMTMQMHMGMLMYAPTDKLTDRKSVV